MLLEYAINEQKIDGEDDFYEGWVGDSDEAWETDASYWGYTSMKGAASYIFNNSQVDERIEGMDEPEKANFVKALAFAKTAFKQLSNTKAMYGVAPRGAVQCGITIPHLVIIDPETGTVNEVIMEGSGGC